MKRPRTGNIDLIPNIGLPRSVAQSWVELGGRFATFVAGGAGGGAWVTVPVVPVCFGSRRPGFHLEPEGGVYPWQRWPQPTCRHTLTSRALVDQGSESRSLRCRSRTAGGRVRYGDRMVDLRFVPMSQDLQR
jgi:hypothetical protein